MRGRASGVSYIIVYLKRSEKDWGEQWDGSLADAKEHARRVVRSKRADQAMVLGDGKIAFRYPALGPSA